MQETIQIENKLKADSDRIMSYMEKIWEELFNKMTQIQADLSDSRWQGVAHDKCVYIHEAILLYSKEIYSFFPDVQGCAQQLQADMISFVNTSDNIALIRLI